MNKSELIKEIERLKVNFDLVEEHNVQLQEEIAVLIKNVTLGNSIIKDKCKVIERLEDEKDTALSLLDKVNKKWTQATIENDQLKEELRIECAIKKGNQDMSNKKGNRFPKFSEYIRKEKESK